jgi:hypothetical protein
MNEKDPPNTSCRAEPRGAVCHPKSRARHARSSGVTEVVSAWPKALPMISSGPHRPDKVCQGVPHSARVDAT